METFKCSRLLTSVCRCILCFHIYFMWNIICIQTTTKLLTIGKFAVISDTFDAHRAVHRNNTSIVNQLDAKVYQIYFILEWYSACFGRSFRPSSGVPTVQTVHTASGICQTDTAICFLACHSKIKLIWYIGACSWFYYRNISDTLACPKSVLEIILCC